MDQKLFFLINQEWTSPWLDLIMVTLSSLDFWVPFLVVLAVVVIARGHFRARTLLLTLALTIGLNEGLVVNFLKKAFDRPRPREALEARTVEFTKIKPRFLALGKPLVIGTSEVKTRPFEGRSFPSGHTTNNFAVATVLALFYRRRGWLYFFVAAGVGYSRIYTAAHWPSDVLFSIPLGCLAGVAGVWLANFIWQRLGQRVVPGIYAQNPSIPPSPATA